MIKKEKIWVKIFRYDPTRDERPKYETYEVPYIKDMRILDALLYIREVLGRGVAFRYGCQVGKCGTCGVLVNGEPKLVCWEPAEKEMTIEPLPHFPVIRDLVIDRSSFDRRRRAMRPFLERMKPPAKFFEDLKHDENVDSMMKLGFCRECLLCLAACPILEVDWKAFAGPAVLVHLAKFAIDPRDELDRIPMAFSEGIYDCSICHKCKAVCPEEIAIPELVLERIRSMVVDEGIGPLEEHKKFAESVIQTGKVIERTETPLLEIVSDVVSVDEPKARVGFFTGCLADYRLQKVGNALIDTLNKNDVEVVIPKEQICCGSPLIRTGQIKEVKQNLVERNVKAFEKYGVKKVVTACPGCTMTWRNNYPKLTKEVLGRKPEFEVLHITEYLTRNIELNTKDMHPIGLKVTWHDPCHLNRGVGVYKEPREIINKIPGLRFVEMEKSDRCCGSGGGLRAGRRDLSYLVANRKATYVEKADADAVVTACPFCEIQLSDVLEKFKVLDIMELLQMGYTPSS